VAQPTQSDQSCVLLRQTSRYAKVWQDLPTVFQLQLFLKDTPYTGPTLTLAYAPCASAAQGCAKVCQET
jgi:hypothetical protein